MLAQAATLSADHPPSSRVEELAALYALTDRLYRAEALEDVFEAALDAIAATLGTSRASILLFDAEGVMRFVASRGLSEAYRSAVDGHSPWTAGTHDPEPIFVADVEATEEPEWLKQAVARENIRALAFIPLVSRRRTIGKFMIYHDAPHAFGLRETELAVAIARQVGFSVERFGAEREQRRVEEELRLSELRFRLMSEDAPVMIWTSDAAGHCVHLNRMLRAFWDVEEADIARFDWTGTIHPDDVERVGAVMGEALREKGATTVKARYRRSDGVYRTLETTARPQFAGDGGFRGMIGVNIDVTEREAAERALRDSEQRQRIAVEAAGLGVFEWTTGDDGAIWQNRRMFEIAGRDPGLGPLGLRAFLADAVAAEDAGGVAAALLDRRAGPDTVRLAFRIRRLDDGALRWVELTGRFDEPAAGGGPRLVGVVCDVTEERRAQEHRQLLVNELNHRVKNTLAVVQGVAKRTFRASRDIPVQLSAFDGRLTALAHAHDLLTRESWRSALLSEVARATLRDRDSDEERIRIHGPPVELSSKQAVTLAMALHELHTNAIKYGALSRDGGRVELAWDVTDAPAPELRLSWTERDGPAVAPPTQRGFGSSMIERALGAEFQARVAMAFPPTGFECRVDAPLPDPGRPSPAAELAAAS